MSSQIGLDAVGQHPSIRHNGGLSAYLSSNRVYPADRAAITVFINAGFSNAQDAIADAIEAVVFDDADETREMRPLFETLRAGQIDRSKLTDNGNFYFTSTALADYRSSLRPLGELKRVVRYEPQGLRGGLMVKKNLFVRGLQTPVCRPR